MQYCQSVVSTADVVVLRSTTSPVPKSIDSMTTDLALVASGAMVGQVASHSFAPPPPAPPEPPVPPVPPEPPPVPPSSPQPNARTLMPRTQTKLFAVLIMIRSRRTYALAGRRSTCRRRRRVVGEPSSYHEVGRVQLFSRALCCA